MRKGQKIKIKITKRPALGTAHVPYSRLSNIVSLMSILGPHRNLVFILALKDVSRDNIWK